VSLVLVLLLGSVATMRRASRPTRPPTPRATAVVTEAVSERQVFSDPSDPSDPSDSSDSSDSSDPSDSSDQTDPSDPSDRLIIDVEPEPGGIYIPPRPAWVESDDVRQGDVHTTAVSSGPHETERDCRRYLDRELKRAVDAYVDWYLGRVYGDRFQASSFVNYDVSSIRGQLVRPDGVHHEVIQVSFGPMHQMHALVEFDGRFRSELDGRRSELDRHWREWMVTGRLWGTALGFGVVLALLGIFCGFFRADTATRGFYTGRLQLLAAVGILTVMVVGAVLAYSILTL
jgi:hypothetical protein